MEKKYKCNLCYTSVDETTGTMMLTEEEYNFAKRLVNIDNWDNLDFYMWAGHLYVYCEELEERGKN